MTKMICQNCQERPATLHFTKIINGEKTEVHLCETCAQEKGETFMFHGGSGFSIHNLLAGLLNAEPHFQQTNANAFPTHEVVRCEHCHMTYSQFAKVGRFGCSECYKAFSNQLEPILRRLHGGNASHTGKIPRRTGGRISLRKKVQDLKQQLRILIEQEEFEKAAVLRDEIRSLEREMSLAQDGRESE